MIIQKSHGKTIPTERQQREEFKMIAKTMFGLEEILADELRECGAKDIEPLTRAVAFTGDMRVLYRANYTCRTALAILKPFAEFEANDDQELYDNVSRIKWEKIIDVDGTFMIDSTTSGDIFTHNLHIADNHVTLLLNSSGESLHKRGYRQAVGVAPINEVLAAGMIKLSGWKCDCNFYDPMCGSGTLLIEAAMLANNIPAQYYRHDNFAFKRWRDFNIAEWKSVKESEDRKIGAGDFECEIWGNDIDIDVLQQAERNLQYAKLHKDVMLYHGSFENQEPPEGKTIIVTNPPYGERIKVEDLNDLYTKLGDTFKKLYGERCEVWLITSDFEAMKHIGLHPSRKIQLFNGSLDCRLLKFELYSGSKKDKFAD